MLYMTWGRENGDATNCANFPVMCTYQGMDSTLRQQYLNLASALDAEVSPVSVVWRHLRQNNPGIDLYQPDESHPSAAGSYAAACSFYTAIFKKDPISISFDHSLNATDATLIRNAAKIEVFDSLNLWDYKQLPKSGFNYITGSGTNQVTFSPANYGVSQTYSWDFGDGTTATTPNPTHSFSSNGTYTITLTTTNCDLQGTHTSISDTTIQFCTHTPSITTTNPWLCAFDTLWTQAADSYQWFAGGVPIPETSQYLPDYQRYGSLSFSVLSTVNGCSELSEIYSANPQWSGYYFDATYGGDPCAGDTALFVVHHINGVLSGNEVIRWYKNGQVLPMANNNDTLLITTQGKYECKVVDPNSNCPLDTTSSSEVVIDCGNLGIDNSPRNESWSLYPNPASENFTVHISKEIEGCDLQVYNATGNLVKSLQVSSDMSVDINTLPNGVYFIHLKSQGYPVLKLLKE